jgi:hypothetical protein
MAVGPGRNSDRISVIALPCDLAQALATQFNVQTLAGCTFTPSTANYSLLATGGTGTFNMSTQTGCPWSAVSDSAWLSVASGASGRSNGVVAFSVAANPYNIPRIGHISIGDGILTTTVNIKQYGPCTYTLSEGPVVAIQPSGGPNTVSVNTQDI